MVELKNVKHIVQLKAPAYTMFESVIAISIITILIALGTMIYSNVIDSENPVAYYQAEEDIKVKREELMQSQAFFNQSFEFENYTIDQEITFHNGNKNLYAVTFRVLQGEKELLKRKHLMVSRESEF